MTVSEFGFVVGNDHAVPKIPEHSGQQRTHRTAPTHNCHGQRLRLVRQLSAQRGLVISTRSQEHTEDGLDLALGQPHLLGATRAIGQDFLFTMRIANAQMMLPFVVRYF
jgi:hypothetical protein